MLGSGCVLSWCLTYGVILYITIIYYILYIYYYYIFYYYILLYYYILYYTLLFSSSSSIPFLLFLSSSSSLSHPLFSHSKYTCRHLDILIYIQSSHSHPNPSSDLLIILPSSALPSTSFKVYVSVLPYTYLYSSLLFFTSSPPLIQSIRVGSYIYLFISHLLLFPSSPNLSLLLFFPSFPSSSPSDSFYTCRYFDILIYTLPSFQYFLPNLPIHSIRVGTYIYLFISQTHLLLFFPIFIFYL